MTKAKTIKFAPPRSDFFSTLTQRVNTHFKTENVSRHANNHMRFKTIFMFCLYFTPYVIMVSGYVLNPWLMLGLSLLMGCGIAGIGLAVMHDANHGAYSKHAWVNSLLGYSLNLVGGSAFNWKVQHNVLHHTYTNIHDVDEDISPRGILRMTPHSKWVFIHRFQFLYAWFFYGLMTLVWVLVKDFVRIIKYQKDGHIQRQKSDVRKEWAILILSKILYVAYIFVLPYYLLPLAWWQLLIGIFAMHYVAGFILAIIFQPAHVIDGTSYPMPDNHGDIHNSWAVHQLCTTTNFANKSRFFSWYVGGLNFQIEHHLFPNICHVHYRKISRIVKDTANEFGLPYRSEPTFVHALWGHTKLLKELGRKPAVVAG
ncbi:MAG: acyl-CoA desaturase [Bacteroidia bacterium]|nr:acyl-CoA desaturase [Bacteroidia bacterium]